MINKEFFLKKSKLARGVSFIVINNKKILLQLRDRYASREKNKWCIPSGGLNKKETPLEALRREFEEELGVKLDISSCTFFKDYLWISEEECFVWYNHNFVYIININLPLQNITIGEGVKFEYKTLKNALMQELAFNHKELIEDILKYEKANKIL